MKEVVILGSGMGGAHLTLELLKITDDINIKLIDLDSLSKPFAIETNIKKYVDRGLQEQRTVGYGYGGSSNLWHGVMGILDDEDWKRLESITDDNNIKASILGGLESLSYYHGSKAKYLGKKIMDSNFQLEKWVSSNSFKPKPYIVQLKPTRFRSKLKSSLKLYKERLILLSGYTAINLNHNQKGSIDSVTIKGKDGKRDIKGDIFIVSLGGLETPRLLEQSFRKSSFANEKIGKGLIDHPHAIIGEITIPKRIFYSQHAVNSLFRHQPLRVGWRIKSKFRLNKSSNHSLIFRPAFSKNENNSRQILKAIITNRSWSTFFKNFFINNEFRKAIFTLGFEKLGIGVWTRKFIVSLQLEHKIEEGGSVITGTDKDEHGRNIPNIERSFPLSFFSEIKHVQNLISQSCSTNAKFKQYEINKGQLLSGSHHSGTARLGSSRVKGVVNKDLQVFGLKNLYICDSSILPIIGNVNLSATIGLFAIRLAKHIKKISRSL
jgi:choline dehydrogenase-like flavoprotein